MLKKGMGECKFKATIIKPDNQLFLTNNSEV